MSIERLEDSLHHARARMRERVASEGRRRGDRGRSRFPEAVEKQIARLLASQERPSLSRVHRQLASFCQARGLRVPARSSLYNAMHRVAVPQLQWAELPEEAARCLYNIAPTCADARIGGDEVVFHAFNYGDSRAMSFASGLPWLCLVRAEQRRGFRPKSRALLRAVMRYRGM